MEEGGEEKVFEKHPALCVHKGDITKMYYGRKKVHYGTESMKVPGPRVQGNIKGKELYLRVGMYVHMFCTTNSSLLCMWN